MTTFLLVLATLYVVVGIAYASFWQYGYVKEKLERLGEVTIGDLAAAVATAIFLGGALGTLVLIAEADSVWKRPVIRRKSD